MVIPLCGGNIDVTTLGRVIERGLAADGRLVRIVANVSDRPGGVAELTALVADMGASVKDIFHERAWLQRNVDQARRRKMRARFERTRIEARSFLSRRCGSRWCSRRAARSTTRSSSAR